MSTLNACAIAMSVLSMAISGRTIYVIKRDERRERQHRIARLNAHMAAEIDQ